MEEGVVMDWDEREKAKKESNSHLYKGKCLRCGHSGLLSKESDLCFGCEQEDLEFEEKRNIPPYDPNDKEAAFRHEKEQQGWPDNMDEEIWNKHFRYK